jgi:enamine deaminase RidA (YjgF/YER057c/UK114 family)
MLAQAESILKQADANLHDVVRTWMWLSRILDWYGDFNRVRSDRFLEHGLLRTDGKSRLPASTGIGISPAGGSRCAMDLIAETGNGRPRFLLSAGRQGAASRYGSAFSRAAITPTPFGMKIHVSGTAAIDATGNTTHVGDAAGQIADTIRCVNAVLLEAGYTPQDVAQTVVYCKTPEVEDIFRRQRDCFPCPYVLTIADICRENLLFEMECIAII